MNIKKKCTQGFKGLLLILFISSVSFNVTHAAVKNVTGQLKLLATVDNRPAFLSVIWEISTHKAGTKKLIKMVKQHAATIELAPGTYQVVLSARNNKAQIYNVTILERERFDLTINLD